MESTSEFFDNLYNTASAPKIIDPGDVFRINDAYGGSRTYLCTPGAGVVSGSFLAPLAHVGGYFPYVPTAMPNRRRRRRRRQPFWAERYPRNHYVTRAQRESMGVTVPKLGRPKVPEHLKKNKKDRTIRLGEKYEEYNKALEGLSKDETQRRLAIKFLKNCVHTGYVKMTNAVGVDGYPSLEDLFRDPTQRKLICHFNDLRKCRRDDIDEEGLWKIVERSFHKKNHGNLIFPVNGIEKKIIDQYPNMETKPNNIPRRTKDTRAELTNREILMTLMGKKG